MRYTPYAFVLLATALAVVSTSAPAATAKVAPSHDQVSYQGWTTTADFDSGISDGVVPASVGDGGIAIGASTGTLLYDDPFNASTNTVRYDSASWTSPTYAVGFGLTQLVASWTADTPPGTWIQFEMQGDKADGGQTKWYVMGRWTSQAPSDAGDIHRTSVGGQGDQDGTIATDTFMAAKGVSLSSYRIRATLFRKQGTSASPTLRSVGAMASALPEDKTVPAGPLGGAEGMVLDVPQYSQEVHRGEYPSFDGGGEAWCSATSTEMVTEYWGAGPGPSAMTDIPYADPSVDYAAMHVFDFRYNGAGNWPFNVAYAGSYGLEGKVVRLRSITEAEQFIKAGIPLVASVSFNKSKLDNAGYSTNGHLLVIRGFTSAGDVIVNDPASRLIASDAAVENVYNRQQFADVWLPNSRSGGIAYVIHPAGVPLPPNTPGLPANW